MELIINPNMPWLPIVMFIIIIIIAIIFGVMNGWQTSIYFFIWNFLGFIAVILTLTFSYEELLNTPLKQFIPNNELQDKLFNSLNVKKIIINNFKSFFSIIFLLIVLWITNLIAFIFYLFFRKKLKKTIFLNKKTLVSNAPSRVLGGSIAFITVLPMVFSIVQISSIIFSKKSFY